MKPEANSEMAHWHNLHNEQELLNKTETNLFTHFTNKSAIQLTFMECPLTWRNLATSSLFSRVT